jgi:hypothetical protein
VFSSRILLLDAIKASQDGQTGALPSFSAHANAVTDGCLRCSAGQLTRFVLAAANSFATAAAAAALTASGGGGVSSTMGRAGV